MTSSTLPLNLLLAFLFVALALSGLLSVYYLRARRIGKLVGEQSDERRKLLLNVHRIEEELRFVLDFIRELPHLTGELNSQANPRGIPEVLLNIILRTFQPEQAVVLVRRKKTLAHPDGERQFVAAAVAAPRSGLTHGMVVGLGEGELGYVAQQGRVMDRATLDREAASSRPVGAEGVASFQPDLAAPMTVGSRTLGIVALRRAERQQPHSSEILRVIAQMGGFALNNLAAFTEVKSVADVDPLTKIWNKGVLSFRLGEVVFEAEENKKTVAIFLFDIDHFKNYNDVNGHVAGDRLLQLLARLVKEQTRMDDILGRFGGEEFLLILPGKTKYQAGLTGDKIRSAIEAYEFPFREKQPGGRLTISGGVACFPEDGRSSSELLRAADQALYEAKRAGRNKVMPASDVTAVGL